MILLSQLVPEHPLRNKPLVGAFYRLPGTSKWHVVDKGFKIAGKTFNQLGVTWRQMQWRFEDGDS